jgi:hypothetical protein
MADSTSRGSVAPAANWPRLSSGAAFYLEASISAFRAASIAPTPLDAIYQAPWGLTVLTITLVRPARLTA